MYTTRTHHSRCTKTPERNCNHYVWGVGSSLSERICVVVSHRVTVDRLALGSEEKIIESASTRKKNNPAEQSRCSVFLFGVRVITCCKQCQARTRRNLGLGAHQVPVR